MTTGGDKPQGSSWIPSGGGECGDLIRATDWGSTPLGPIESWSTSLRTIVQTMLCSRHPMFLFWGPELVQLYNDAYRPSFGEGKHPRAMGQRGRECWGEIWSIVEPQIEGVLANGVPTWHEDALVPIYRNGGIEEVFWSYGYSPAFDDDGTIGGTLVVCTETTSGVLANRRLDLIARVTEQASSAESTSDLLARVFDCCQELEVDIPCATALGQDGSQMADGYGFGPDDLGHLRATIAARGSRDEAFELELPAPIPAGPWPEPVESALIVPFAPHGHLVFGLSSRLPFDDAYRGFLLQLAESIQSARGRVREALRRIRVERERAELLSQAPVAAAVLMGPDHVFELANARFRAMIGRDVSGMRLVDAFPETVGTPIHDIIRGVYQSGIPYATDEMPIDLADQLEKTYFKFNLEPIRDSDGTVDGMMAIAVDVTDIVKAREEREQLVARLEEASKAKDDFLAMLGHELRNPLAPIRTALDLIDTSDSDPFAKEHAIIRRQTAHLARLVDDLLDVARIVRGKIDLRPERCDIGAVVKKAIEIAETPIESRRHRLKVDVPAEISWTVDPARLAQVLSNLLTNAALYTPPGGLIEISAVATGNELVMTVVDNGRGIRPEMLDHVFDMFVQGRQSSDREKGGLGLGLALSKNLVELHGGTISVQSEGLGTGSSFEIRLPASSGLAPEPKPTSSPSTRLRRILVVDDNVDAADMLAARLESEGHAVEVTYDGVSALATCEQFKPEVAILDIGLPVMDGYELARRIAAAEATRDCRLIALTGYAQRKDRESSAAAGFHEHIVKPVSIEELLRAIEPS